MPPDSSPYGLPSTSAANSPSAVIDLEECIHQEMLRQAGIAPDVPQLPYLKTELLLHQKKNLRRMIDLENEGRSILQMDAIGMGKTCKHIHSPTSLCGVGQGVRKCWRYFGAKDRSWRGQEMDFE
jgi:hypothetical protein